MSDHQQLGSLSAEARQPAPAAAQDSVSVGGHDRPSRFVAKLRFFRAMLWMLVYACAGLFLISVIILDGLRLQSKIIGGALLAILALIAVSYGLQWHS